MTRGGSNGAILIVLMATATIGTFAGAMLVHLDRASEAVAWEEIGAPYRIEAPAPLPASFDAAALPGVEAAAGQYEVTSLVQDRFLPLEFIAIDAAAYEEVIAGAPPDVHLPPEMLTPAADPVPAIVTHHMTEGNKGIGVGDTFNLFVEGYNVKFQVAEVRDAWPGEVSNQAFVLASRDQHAGAPRRRRAAIVLHGLCESASRGGRRPPGRGAPRGPGRGHRQPRDSDRIDRELTDDARARGGRRARRARRLCLRCARGLRGARPDGASRSVEVAHLRTMGLSRREALGLIIVEHGPTIVVAFVAGVALGLALFALLRDSLGLASLVGAPIVVDVGIDPVQLGAVLLAVVTIVALGIGLGAALQRNAAPVAAVRRGFE